MLCTWRESPLYSDRERAALAWTESLTLISQTSVPDAHYDVNLTVAIGMINLWNRWAVGFRSQHPVGMDKRVG